jgi:hypothetical protein
MAGRWGQDHLHLGGSGRGKATGTHGANIRESAGQAARFDGNNGFPVQTRMRQGARVRLPWMVNDLQVI